MIKSALFVDANWSKYKAGLDVPEFHDTLEAFQDYNSSVINKEGLELATIGCQVSNSPGFYIGRFILYDVSISLS